MFRLFPLVALLVGCPEIVDESDKSPADSGTGGLPDEDGDGYDTEQDCDDANAAINPSADELCDGLDQNCDGVVDENAADAPAWFADADGDSFGDASAKKTSCEQPSGYVADSSDCNDADSAYHPGADEAACSPADPDYNCNGVADTVDADGDGYFNCDDCDDEQVTVFPGNPEACDGLDNDCNGAIDDGFGAGNNYYADSDGDGFGDPFTLVTACAAPPEFVENSDDCDDVLPTVYPGASEYCNDYDDDCDGAVDEAGAVDVVVWHRDADGDGYGSGTATATACDAPSGYVADGTDCSDGNGAIYPGAPEYCGGTDYDCDGATNEADSVNVVAYYSDADGDGYDGAVAGYACSAPSGYSAVVEDCDESDPSVNPAADDDCDNVDNDCDGDIDDGRRVPADYATISRAITAARTGESVCVATGDYYEDIDFGGKSITVQGEGSTLTTIYGTGTQSVVSMNSGESTPVLRGFTITGGESAQGAGLVVSAGTPTLDDLVITKNTCTTSSYCYGAGMYLYGSPTLTNVVVTENEAVPTATSYSYVYGAGAYIVATAGTFSGLEVSSNYADVSSATSSGSVYGGGLYLSDTYATFEDVDISYNVCFRSTSTTSTYAYSYGCGMAAMYGGADFDGLTVYGNQAVLAGTYDYAYGTGIYNYYDRSSFTHTKLVYNTADAYGVYGVAWYGYYESDISFTNSILAGNRTAYYFTPSGAYGTMYVDYESSITLTNVDIVSNKLYATYAYGGGLYAGYYGDATFVNTSVYANVLSGSNVTGGAIMGYGSTYAGTISASYSNFYSNTSAEFYNLTSPVGSSGNVAVSPGYTSTSASDPASWDLTLKSGSSLSNAGDPAILDADGSRSDVGAYGGPEGSGW